MEGERIKEKGTRGSRDVKTIKSILRESNKVPSHEDADEVRPLSHCQTDILWATPPLPPFSAHHYHYH